MTEMNNNVLDQAREEALSLPLDEIHLGEAHRFESNTHWPFFDRVRREAPVHFCPESEFGPYWSIMRWDDIMTAETSHKALSSADGIFIGDRVADFVPRNLCILWEEVLKRFDRIDVVGEAKRTRSNFVMGFEDLPVKIAA